MRKELLKQEDARRRLTCCEAFVIYKDRLFEGILRPMLIYKYELNKIKAAREVFETFRSHAPNLDKMMLNEIKSGVPGLCADFHDTGAI